MPPHLNKFGLLALLIVATFQATTHLSMFYCGFGGDFCGQSSTDDVNPNSHIIILAFANTQSNGAIVVDEDNFPNNYVSKWQSAGKKILISVGGQNGNWNFVFASQSNTRNFIASISQVIQKYELDGVDLDIEGYFNTPRTVANMINNLRTELDKLGGRKLIVVSPEDVTIYQGTGVPGPDIPGQAFNYFVHIVKLAGQSIDLYQPQAYNNWYDGLPGGSLDYLKDVYLNWRNYQGLGRWSGPIPDFDGVPASKLLIGVLASSSAGGAAYYAPPQVILDFKAWLAANNYEVYGFMMWDSHWDTRNNLAVSNAIVAGNSKVDSQDETQPQLNIVRGEIVE